MKRLLALILCLAILTTGCVKNNTGKSETNAVDVVTEIVDSVPQVSSLNDPELLMWYEDSVYAELEKNLNNDKYTVESVSATFISQDYINELMYNSQSNIFFGYSLDDVGEFFADTRYVFTLGDDGQTAVQELIEYQDHTTETILKNVAIGTGVILVCVIVAVATEGTAVPAYVSAVFAASAKSAAIAAGSSALIGGVGAGIVRGIETGDMNEALNAGTLAVSDGFKWGAISGAIIGGASKGIQIYRANNSIPLPRKSELDVLARTENATEQVAFIGGKQVPPTTPGSTRPDVVVANANGTVHAIEVKNYNLAHNEQRLLDELERQVTSRVSNLPQGSTQEIVLDVRGRGYSEEFLNSVISDIQNRLDNVYSNIPVSLLRW